MSTTGRTIVVGAGTVREPDPVLEPAARLAERTGAELHVVHAFEGPEPLWDAYAGVDAFTGEAERHYAERVREDLARHVTPLAPGATVRAVAGPPDRALTRYADEVGADLLVVGTTRRSRVAQMLLGTGAGHIVRAAHRPVLVLRPEGTAAERVLLATDLSGSAARAHERGRETVERFFGPDGRAWRSLLVLRYDVPMPPPLDRGALEEAAESGLERFLADRSGQVEGRVRVGEPAREIVAEARDWPADLLVVGTHGRRGAARFFLGSVAESVLRHAPCSALVIPETEHEEEP